MNERVYQQIKDAITLFCRLQGTRTKEEAFLKGLYFGLGGELARPKPNWGLIKRNPEMFIPIEQDIAEIYGNVMKDQIQMTEIILRELYENEGRVTPPWLKDK
jgi:hypothetical protein